MTTKTIKFCSIGNAHKWERQNVVTITTRFLGLPISRQQFTEDIPSYVIICFACFGDLGGWQSPLLKRFGWNQETRDSERPYTQAAEKSVQASCKIYRNRK